MSAHARRPGHMQEESRGTLKMHRRPAVKEIPARPCPRVHRANWFSRTLLDYANAPSRHSIQMLTRILDFESGNVFMFAFAGLLIAGPQNIFYYYKL